MAAAPITCTLPWQQIFDEGKKFAFNCGLNVCVAYGGAPFGEQVMKAITTGGSPQLLHRL